MLDIRVRALPAYLMEEIGGGDMATWNPWHGCKKISPGCANCYVYRRDAEFGKDSSMVTHTSSFDMPMKRNR